MKGGFPESLRRKDAEPKPKGGIAIIIAAKPKADKLGKDLPTDKPSNGKPAMDGGTVSPEKAGFHDQNETCQNCAHFAEEGAGKCLKGVAVDFGVSYPDASHCTKYWESGGEAMAEAPEKAEVA